MIKAQEHRRRHQQEERAARAAGTGQRDPYRHDADQSTAAYSLPANCGPHSSVSALVTGSSLPTYRAITAPHWKACGDGG